MTITLDLAPEQEARLQEKASQHGQTIPEYLLSLADRETLTLRQQAAEFRRDLEALAAMNAQMGMRSPSDEALRRENMYEDRP